MNEPKFQIGDPVVIKISGESGFIIKNDPEKFIPYNVYAVHYKDING
jgi:hypothetical protein